MMYLEKNSSVPASGAADSIAGTELVRHVLGQWRKVAAITIATGVFTYGALWLVAPTFTARISFISPQQQQNSAAGALASLGNLAALPGIGGAVKSPADQYVALLQSVSIRNRIIDRFNLIDIYEAKYREDALKALSGNVSVGVGKKDNLITLDVSDHSAQRAADIANAYVDELRNMTNTMAMSEAQQRRSFFESKLTTARASLTDAQNRLQQSGFDGGALRSEPKAAADLYARTKAEAASVEVRLRTYQQSRANSSPEVLQLTETLNALRAQLSRMEQPSNGSSTAGYVTAYRDFKYYETLFDIYARQFEVAKLDEAREGALIQVVDAATPPERKSGPKRAQITVFMSLAAMVLAALVFATRRALSGNS